MLSNNICVIIFTYHRSVEYSNPISQTVLTHFLYCSITAPTIEFEQASYQVREPPGPDGIEVLNIKVIRKGDLDRTSKIRCSTRDGSAQSGVDYNPKSRVLKFSPGLLRIKLYF